VSRPTAVLDFWGEFAALGATVALSTRAGGVSSGPYATCNLGLHVGDDPDAVLENRARVAAAFGAKPEALAFCTQVHGTTVRTASGGAGLGTSIGEADALVTTRPGTVLVILVADCMPVVLFDPVARVLGCAHAGWRGTTAGVLDSTIDAMVALGAATERMTVGLGPAVPASRYQVGPDVADAVRVCLGQGADEVLCPDDEGRWRLDLVGAGRQLLLSAGVRADAVLVHPATTGATGPYFSDRAVRPCGRFGLLARIEP
jgi:polyphenol oxidase